jgi:hypothetical protein
MSRIFAFFLLTSLAMGNVHDQQLKGITDCLSTYLPKLADDAQLIYRDYQALDISALVKDIEALAVDAQAAAECLKTQIPVAMQNKLVKKVVKGFVECVNSSAEDIKYDIETIKNHFSTYDLINVLNDLGRLYDHTQDLLECFGIPPDSAEFAEAIKKLDETDVLSCLFQYVPTLVEDISKLASAISSGDFSAVFAGVQTLVADGQALTTCLSQA